MTYKYNFDEVINRRESGSYKWNIADDELPLWVADMDFKAAPCILEAIEKRVNNGVFGYQVVTDNWYESYISWWNRRHNYIITKDELIFCTGVVPAISCGIRYLTNVGDNVVVMTPVYNIFFKSIENHGRHAIENKLCYQDEKYNIDFEDLEKKLSHPNTTLLILCNPHNPIGKIWTREELNKIGTLCYENNVTVISDEIHCDIVDPGYEYIPFASVSPKCEEISITCLSASKTFNMAGMQSAAVMVKNEGLRNIINRGLNSSEIAEPNAFACDTTAAAFNNGEEWLEELKKYILSNKQYVRDYIENEIPKFKVVSEHATYLLWIDISGISNNSEKFCNKLREETGLYLSNGEEYHGNGNHFVRLNTACPKEVLIEAMKRLKEYVASC